MSKTTSAVMLALLFACGVAQADGWACPVTAASGGLRSVKTNEWLETPKSMFRTESYVIKKTSTPDSTLPVFVRALPHEWSIYNKVDLPPLAFCGKSESANFVCVAGTPDQDNTTYSFLFDPAKLEIMATAISPYFWIVQMGKCIPI